MVKIHKSKREAQVAAVDATVTSLIKKALNASATDVHIEPREHNVAVRFRLDGWLQEVAKLPLPALTELGRNVKKRAGLDADDSSAPQNGSFQFDAHEPAATVRVATMPTIAGEKIALHLSPQLSESVTLEQLGFWGEMLDQIANAVVEPHGLVVVASPNKVGAGMTLLGIAHLLESPALNIASLEDPIEHQVAGINQTQVNPAAGMNFANGLQALLKQDPNVILVSDMHEAEALEVALQASLGGHLVLGGLHVRDAAHGVAHLLHMHAQPFLVASALKLSLGQRFVRRLCTRCRQPFAPDTAERKDLQRLLRAGGIGSVKKLHELEQAAAQAGVGGEDDSLSTSEAGITRLWRAHPDGCPHCRFSGYQGRLGICEVLPNSDRARQLIADKAPTAALQQLAIAEGMVPLPCDGLVKALRGLTSLEEILPLAA